MKVERVVFGIALLALAACSDHGDGSLQADSLQSGQKTLRLLLSGQMKGRLEPCGCASAQTGGIDRRARWLKLNRSRYDLKLEGGNMVRENNALERLKMISIQTILGGMLEYRLFTLGPADMSLGMDELSLHLTDDGGPFVATDVRRVDGDKVTAPFWVSSIQEAGSYRVLVLGLAGALPGKTGFELLDPDVAVRAAIAKAGRRGRDWQLCLCFVNFGGATAARKLASKLPGVDLVVSFQDDLETIAKPEVVARDVDRAGVARTQILFPGWRGKNMLLWEGRRDATGSWETVRSTKEPLSATPVPKGKRPPESDPEVWNMLIEHKREVGELDVLEAMADHRPTANGSTYVGSKACAACHVQAYEQWVSSDHAKAWTTLVKRERIDKWPVTEHPDCVSCHSVGYGDKSGFINMKRTPELAAVGCEACHGAGKAHIDALQPIQDRLNRGEQVERKTIRAALKSAKLPRVKAKTCHHCHDFEQSPGFRFRERKKKIEHGLDK